MSWMNSNLDKVQNKCKCSCGAESVHGVYDDENNHIGEFCDTCFGVYLVNQGAGHDLDISTNTYKELAELREKQEWQLIPPALFMVKRRKAANASR